MNRPGKSSFAISILLNCLALLTPPIASARWFEWNTRRVASLGVQAEYGTVAVSGRYAYLTGSERLRVFDLANPEEPELVSEQEFDLYSSEILGDILFAGLHGGGLAGGFALFDIADREDPQLICNLESNDFMKSPVIYEDLLYVCANQAVLIFSISDIENPDWVGFFTMEGNFTTYDLALREEVLYVGHSRGFTAFDIGNPLEPQMITTCDTLARMHRMQLQDDFLWLVGWDGRVVLVDVSAIDNPELMGYSLVPYAENMSIQDFTIDDTLLYAVDVSHGMRVWDVADPENVVEVGYYDLPGIEYGGHNVRGAVSVDLIDHLPIVAYRWWPPEILDYDENGSTILANPTNLDYATILPGESSRLNFILSNVGRFEQRITEFVFQGESFIPDFERQITLQPDEEIELELEFAPAESGEFYDTLSLVIENQTSPPPITLHGSATVMEVVSETTLFRRIYDLVLDGQTAIISGSGRVGQLYLLDMSNLQNPDVLDSLDIQNFGAPSRFGYRDGHIYFGLYDWIDWNIFEHAFMELAIEDDQLREVGNANPWNLQLGEYETIWNYCRTENQLLAIGDMGLAIWDYEAEEGEVHADWNFGGAPLEPFGDFLALATREEEQNSLSLIVPEDMDAPEFSQIAVETESLWINDIVSTGDFIYVAAGDLYVFDFSDPNEPELIRTIQTPGGSRHIAIAGGALVLADASSIRIYDISDPFDITLLSVSYLPTAFVGVISDQIISFASEGRITVLDAADVFDLIGERRERRQQINLENGWNIVSLNIVPTPDLWIDDLGPDIPRLWSQMQLPDEAHVVSLLKDMVGRFWLPWIDFINIPYWNLNQGYMVNVDRDTTVSWDGLSIDAQSDIPLRRGWNTIAFLPNYPLDASSPNFSVLAPILENVRYAKNSAGEFMIPAENFSNMPPWEPGEGYMVNVNQELVFNYPERGLAACLPRFAPQPAPIHFRPPRLTGFNMSLLITTTMGFDGVQEFGVFDGEGRCVGAAGAGIGSQIGLAIWGDDSSSAEVDGAAEGTDLTVRQWDGQIERPANFIFREGSLRYSTDSFVTAEYKASQPIEFRLHGPYPSPFNSSTTISFSLPPGSGEAGLRVYDLSGRLVADLTEKSEIRNQKSEIGKVVWNASDLPAGLYLIKLESEAQSATQKIVLLK